MSGAELYAKISRSLYFMRNSGSTKSPFVEGIGWLCSYENVNELVRTATSIQATEKAVRLFNAIVKDVPSKANEETISLIVRDIVATARRKRSRIDRFRHKHRFDMLYSDAELIQKFGVVTSGPWTHGASWSRRLAVRRNELITATIIGKQNRRMYRFADEIMGRKT